MIILTFFAWLTFFATTDYFVVAKGYKSTNIRYLLFCLISTSCMTLIQFYIAGLSLEIKDDLVSASAIATALLVFQLAFPKVRSFLNSES